MSERIAKSLKVKGIVQGVGFRPFVYRLARQYELKGSVANTDSGVLVHLEGEIEHIESFIKDLYEKSPRIARITEVSIQPAILKGFIDFTITKSQTRADKSTLISPDISICEDCLRELFDPKDRRFCYPFINCTNCGPRYTIISDIPYDRPNTAMRDFKMCPSCQAEYDDPLNRRFHAQPNACDICGPHVMLIDQNKNEIATDDPINHAASLLFQGHIIAIKGLGGFHLAVNAENDEAVNRLRMQKHREHKPFALMSLNLERIRKYAYVEPEEAALLQSIQRPIVLLKKKIPNSISGAVSHNNRYFGVMLPYTPLHYLIMRHNFTALVMTSGNLSEEPIAIENQDALNRLSGIADYFLIHNRNIYLRSDDSIIRYAAGSSRIIRRSRGYVPVPVFLKKKIMPVLACGAELKNTVCITKENRAFLSQHIGDMENLPTYDFFIQTIEHMKRILNISPKVIAHDLHPDYMSTRYALEQDIPKIGVQHHHAHIVSCMAENQIDGPVIGLSFDGTGYGDDGNIWGGEVLIADTADFKRAGHLAYVPMPGGAAAIKEPWRMAIAYLYETFGKEFQNIDLPLIKQIGHEKIAVIVKMIENRINSPYTSSMGRLFDGVSAMLNIRTHVFFEGQAAMELEMAADNSPPNPNLFETQLSNSPPNPPPPPLGGRGVERGASGVSYFEKEIGEFPIQPIIRGIVEDMINGVSIEQISRKFHNTLICFFSDICAILRDETGINHVVLSGGVFQNKIILTGLIRSLEKMNFNVFSHAQVPTNDGGISLGQAIIAASKSFEFL